MVTGPSVLDVFNSLLRHLRTSVSSQSAACRSSLIKSSQLCVDSAAVSQLNINSDHDVLVEQQFQNAVVNAIGTSNSLMFHLLHSAALL